MKNDQRLTAAEVRVLNFCVNQMDDLDASEWLQHGFRQSTFESVSRNVGSLLGAPVAAQPPEATAEPKGRSTDNIEARLSSLLAMIQRDVGQFECQKGTVEACFVAEQKIAEWLARDDAEATAQPVASTAIKEALTLAFDTLGKCRDFIREPTGKKMDIESEIVRARAVVFNAPSTAAGAAAPAEGAAK